MGGKDIKWKPDVLVKRTNGCALRLVDRVHTVPKDGLLLVDAMERSSTENEALILLIMQREGINETAIAFGLAQFLTDFGDFIAPDTYHYMITN